MRLFQLLVATVLLPLTAQADTAATITHQAQRCDGVIITCVFFPAENRPEQCGLALPDGKSLVQRLADGVIVEFDEHIELHHQVRNWLDVVDVRDSFLIHNQFAPWNGADEQLPVCDALS